MKTIDDLAKMFETTFKVEADKDRLQALVDFWGFQKVYDTVNYLLINGVRKAPEGKNNPYGLIYSLAHRIEKFEH